MKSKRILKELTPLYARALVEYFGDLDKDDGDYKGAALQLCQGGGPGLYEAVEALLKKRAAKKRKAKKGGKS